MKKAFKSWKIYKQQCKAKRAQLRTFWCIKSMIILIDNSSIYDKSIYPSQIFSCPVTSYNAKELEMTVAAYNDSLLKRLFAHWKGYYHNLRNFKAKIAYSYIKTSFNAWNIYKNESIILKNKRNSWSTKNNERAIWRVFYALKDYINKKTKLRGIYDLYYASKSKERLLNSIQIWTHELRKKLEYQHKCEIADSHYVNVLQKEYFKKFKEYQVYKILVKEWYHLYFEYKDNTLLAEESHITAGTLCCIL